MSMEMHLLLWSVALAAVQVLIAVAGVLPQVGLPRAAGNRENFPEATGWAGRAVRAHRNLLENLILFAILVLIANAQKISNPMTVLGAQLFFWARVVYVPVYVIGIPWVRTLVYSFSLAGLVLIFLQLVKA
jgi:uncharacterized MAPEG superfamily protein